MKKKLRQTNAFPKKFWNLFPNGVIAGLFFLIGYGTHGDLKPVLWTLFPASPHWCGLVAPRDGEASPSVSIGFSPGGSAQTLVLDAIDQAQCDIHLAAYVFTAQSVAQALIRAAERGVQVFVIINGRSPATESGSEENSALSSAVTLMQQHNIHIRLNSHYAIHHDKYIIIDRKHLQTGSFNYSFSADKRNSENIVVLWDQPEVAQRYLQHWNQRWHEGVPIYEPSSTS